MATTRTTTSKMTVKITPNDKGNPPGKLADAELHFSDGPLAGLKLIGFSIWERRGGNGRNVTFPARQYSVNGERRSFALLRPITDVAEHEAGHQEDPAERPSHTLSVLIGRDHKREPPREQQHRRKKEEPCEGAQHRAAI